MVSLHFDFFVVQGFNALQYFQYSYNNIKHYTCDINPYKQLPTHVLSYLL